MRRPDKEITDREQIEAIIAKAQVCRLAMIDGDQPYVVPMNFGYDDHALFFHCATVGRKLDVLANNNRVCFEMDVDHELKSGARACDFGMGYQSVIGWGEARVLSDPDEMVAALDLIVRHYGVTPEAYSEAGLKAIKIIRVEVEEMTAKQS